MMDIRDLIDESNARIYKLYQEMDEANSVADDAKDERDYYAEKLKKITDRLVATILGLGGNESAGELRMMLLQIAYEADEGRFNALWDLHRDEL